MRWFKLALLGELATFGLTKLTVLSLIKPVSLLFGIKLAWYGEFRALGGKNWALVGGTGVDASSLYKLLFAGRDDDGDE